MSEVLSMLVAITLVLAISKWLGPSPSVIAADEERPAPVPNPTIEDIAHVAHEANRAYCRVLDDNTEEAPWEDLPAGHRQSTLADVEALLNGVARTPEKSHESWLAHMRADGWRYGPAKSVAAKTHPCMLDFGYLPSAQRLKDELFRAVVHTLSART
jgi:hypothetical protein